MRFASAHKTPHARTEQIILFRCSTQVFAISSASVQEVRSVDSLAGSPMEIEEPSLPKVRHMFRRGEQNLYVVNGAVHFGLRPSPASLIFLLRRARTALLIDGIEKMTTMTRLQALPAAFCRDERVWYRGLTVLDQSVLPVVSPEGFLTADELFRLDALAGRLRMPESAAAGEMGLGL
ncbi:MAG TPA: chemotaxis protein CheW [Candidatus Acidoferrum sp.]|nr:chemotaxis protein CheW [Candidatus Acidoferrum sp.]